MKKRLFGVLLAVIMVVSLSTIGALADDGTFKDSSGIRYRITSESTVSVVSNTDDNSGYPGLPYNGIGRGQSTYRGDIVIPSTVSNGDVTYKVTVIEGFAFYWTDITTISIPNTVTKLESLAFYNCHNLTSVSFTGEGEGLLEIGGSAFESCYNLSTFSIPSTVKIIGNAAFGGCRSLNRLHIPAGVTDGLVKALVGNTLYPYLENVTIAEGSPYQIEGGVLYKGTEAQLYMGPDENVVLREGTTSIAGPDEFNAYSGVKGAFAQTYDLKSITLPDTITEIPANAFNSAVNMATIELPDGLKSIGNSAFYNTGLTSIDIPDSVETIGDGAFKGAINATEISLPSGLKSLGEEAFMDNYELESIVIPEGVKEIPESAFDGCKNLNFIVVPATVTSIDSKAFNGIAEGATITFLGTTPPTIADNALGTSKPADLTVIVPAGAEDAYSQDGVIGNYIEQGSDSGYSLEVPASANVAVDGSVDLNVNYSPATVNLSYESSDTSIVTVTGDGTVTGVAPGTAVITVTLKLGDVTLTSATCTVTVTIPATGIALNTGELTFTIGDRVQTAQLVATVSPETATNQSVTWVSSNPVVATVSANGLVTAVSPGTAVITVTAADGGWTATCTVTVRPRPVNLPDTYDIELVTSDGGEASLSLNNSSEGATIAVTAIPDEGYELDYITVNGERISGTTFTMPDHDVTVRVYFREIGAGLPFTDVNSGDWFYDYVEYVYTNGLMDGVSDTQFDPNGNMTRAMVWAILARMDGERVTGSNWVETAQAWAVASGVSDGENASGLVTREELATMLWRYAGEYASSYSLSAYSDASSVSNWAATAMAWAVEQGIITGTSAATIDPQGTATRAQCAAMLMRYLELV